MNEVSHTVLLVLFVAQVLGLVSAAAARISLGSRYQHSAQWAFFGCLCLVGLMVAIAVGIGPGCWLTSGTTFSVMILTVTCDFNHAPGTSR